MSGEHDSPEDTTFGQVRTRGSEAGPHSSGDASSVFIRDRSGNATREEVVLEIEADLKFRHVDFAHGGSAQREADEKYLVHDNKTVRVTTEEQKSLATTGSEPKSPGILRGARILTSSTLGEQHTPRNARNEKEFQHLESVFQMVSPFGSQDADYLEPDHSTLELVRSPSYQSRHYSKGHHPRWEQYRPELGRMVPALRSHHLQDRCSPSCTCVCHSQAHIGRGVLSAFKIAFGSFTFIFNTRASTTSCNVPTCVSRRGQYFQIIYSFPAWLFHTAVSATLKDWTTGSPELLLRVHRRIDARMMATYTSIFGYITRGEMESVKRVLSRREASIYDVAGVAGVSMLYHALRLRQIDVVELLICEGADMFQLDDAGLGPFHEAIQVMYAAANTPFQFRLQDILPMDQVMEAAELTGLHKIAMGIRWMSVADYVASNGYDDVNTGDSNSQTPLYYASAQGNSAVVQSLLQAGASPDGVPKQGSSSAPPAVPQAWTPLCVAARNGHLDVVQQLLGAGAQANLRCKHNRTALHECSPSRGDHALQDTFVDISACLVAHGADLKAEDSYRSTVLDTTCIRDHARVAAFFIERGVDPTHRDWEGSNALHNSVGMNSLTCAALLLGLGQERSGLAGIDDNGSSTLHYTATGGSADMMALLAGSGLCGLDAELKDEQGRTALDVLNGRSGVTDELRDAFMRCLRSLSRPETADLESQDSNSDGGFLEFFDAVESLT